MTGRQSPFYHPAVSDPTFRSNRAKLVRIQVYLCVLCGDLQQQSQGIVVKHLVQSEQRPMDSALIKVAAVLLQPNGLDPADHTLITPHQHI